MTYSDACKLRKKNFEIMEVKEVYLYSVVLRAPHLECARVLTTQFYLQITQYLPISRKRSPDGATTDCGGRIVL